MAKLAIRGHATRGKEVIEILEMLGGENNAQLNGTDTIMVYHIRSEGYIDTWYAVSNKHCKVFTLEEFLEKYPYKVEEKVCFSDAPFTELTISKIWWNEDANDIECTFIEVDIDVPMKDLQPYKEAPMYLNEKANKQADEISKILEPVKEIMDEGVYAYNEINCYHQDFADKVRIRLGGDYEIKVEEGKTYIVRKNPAYPKTYEECCDILDVEPYSRSAGYKSDIITAFRNLLIYRDAYWKIASEETWLGKPWEPDWRGKKKKYLIVFVESKYFPDETFAENRILAFPTEEMRDAFYENFKDLIEHCKELL